MLETLSLMGMGFIHAMNPLTLVLMIGATALGITIGCLPRFVRCDGRCPSAPGDLRYGPSDRFDRLRRYLLRCDLRRLDFRDSDSHTGYTCLCCDRH